MEDLKLQAMRRLAKLKLEGMNQNSNQEPTIDESDTHDNISFMDRFQVKNFGNSNESSMKFLQDKHPDMEFKEHDGRIITRAKGESSYRPIDPEGFDMADITDVAYDVGAGAVEGAAGIAAGLATANPIVGVGAAGALGAGAETVRQQVGKSLGINEEIDGTDIALSGTFAGLVPVAGKAIAPAVKGAARGFRNTIVPALTTATKDHVEILAKNGNQLKDTISNGFTDLFERSGEKVNKGLTGLRNDIGNDFRLLKESGRELDVSTVKNVYNNKIDELVKSNLDPNGKGSIGETIEALQKDRDSIFPEGAPMSQTFEQSLLTKGSIVDKANFPKPGRIVTSNSPELVESTARDAVTELNGAVDEVMESFGSKDARSRYASYKQLERIAAPLFKDPTKIEQVFKQATKGQKKTLIEALKRMDDELGTNVLDDIKLADAAQFFGSGDPVNQIVDQMRPKSALEEVGKSAGIRAVLNSNSPGLFGIASHVGGRVGQKVAGPNAVRRYVQGSLGIERGARITDVAIRKMLKKKVFGNLKRKDLVRELSKQGYDIQSER
jgi:hypothetical protein